MVLKVRITRPYRKHGCVLWGYAHPHTHTYPKWKRGNVEMWKRGNVENQILDSKNG